VLSVDRIVATPATYQTRPTANPLVGPMRPEVKRAMQMMHEMPPYAREREIESGWYSQFSAEEKQLLRSVSGDAQREAAEERAERIEKYSVQ
jgi:hypothetical protein